MEGGWEDITLTTRKVLEFAYKDYFLYVTRDSTKKAELLGMLCSKFSVEDAGMALAYRYPFNAISKSAKANEWSGREDSNLRPPGPEPGALPG